MGDRVSCLSQKYTIGPYGSSWACFRLSVPRWEVYAQICSDVAKRALLFWGFRLVQWTVVTLGSSAQRALREAVRAVFAFFGDPIG